MLMVDGRPTILSPRGGYGGQEHLVNINSDVNKELQGEAEGSGRAVKYLYP